MKNNGFPRTPPNRPALLIAIGIVKTPIPKKIKLKLNFKYYSIHSAFREVTLGLARRFLQYSEIQGEREKMAN